MDLAALCLLALSLVGLTHQSRIVCYYGSWATYRSGNGKCNVEHLDPFVCTHLVYAFAGINEDATLRIADPWLELPDNWGRDNYGAFNKLKLKNPNLKTLIAVGGWNEGSAKFSKVANDPSLRVKFAQNAANFAVKYGFDGVDMDWEYPAQRDSTNPSTDRQAFTLMLKEMKAVFDPLKLLLTAAVGATAGSASQSYDIKAISGYLSFINVMAYDFHGGWDTKTGHNAALKAYPSDPINANYVAVINYWISQGAPREKITIGMPTYGRTFRLGNLQQNGVGAPSVGAGIGGQYTQESGFIGYNELCEKKVTEQWPEMWDSSAVVPYTYNGNNWISYDNGKSLNEKAKYVASLGLGGAMIWSIETDDFRNVCGAGAFPLLRQIKAGLGNISTPSTPMPTTTRPTLTTTKPTLTTTRPTLTTTRPTLTTTRPTLTTTRPTLTTTKRPGSFSCTKQGYFRDPIACDVFYYCLWNGQTFLKYDFRCPPGTFFDPSLVACNHQSNVQC